LRRIELDKLKKNEMEELLNKKNVEFHLDKVQLE